MKKLILMLALVLGVFAFSQKSQAQHHNHGHYQREYIRCESNGYNYNECRPYHIDRIDRVRLVQQHSKAPCYFRDSWGADSWAVWVDRGCRATIEVQGWGW